MSTTSFEIHGLGSLLVKFDSINYDLKVRGGRAALRKAANVVRDAAIASARQLDDPATAEQIAKNIVVRWSPKVFKRTGNLQFRVGVLGGARSTSRDALKSAARRRRQGIKSLEDLGEIAGAGKGNPGGDTWYWRMLEFGTSKVGPTPFMRPALDLSVVPATDTFIREYEKAIDRAIKRAAKKAAA